MKRLLISLISLAILATACAPMALQPAPTPTPIPPTTTPTPVPVELTPVQKAALQALALALNVPVEQIKLTSTEAVEWSDGCLGVGSPVMSCLAVIVPGYRVMFEYDGYAYEVRTNEDGNTVALGEPLFRAWGAQEIVRQQLANKFGEAVEFTLVSIEAREWPNACLGLSAPNIRCAEAVTPGFRMVWEVNGKTYTYHTNLEGTAVQEAVAMLTWSRQGGIAGFCDSLTVNANGEAFYGKCGEPEKQAELSEAETAQLKAWGEKYGGLMIDHSDPEGVSDRMTTIVQFSAFGNEYPSEADEQTMFVWAQEVYNRLSGQ